MGGSPLPEIVQTPGGESMRLADRWLLSSRQPRRRCEETAAAFVPAERSLVLCPSPLLGYGIDIVLSRLPPSSLLLCVEADPALLELSRQRLGTAILSHPLFRLLGAESPAGLVSSIVEAQGPFRRLQYLELTGGVALAPSTYAAVRAALEEGIRERWANRATLWKMGRLWIRNLLKNLPSLCRSIAPEELFRSAEGKAILIAGAGPSLEEALPWIERNRSALFILSVDTALLPLHGAGIRSDAAICLEAQVHNLADFIGVADTGTALVADLVSHPASLRALSGPFCPIASRFADLGILRRLAEKGIIPPPFPPLGSVGVAACAFALEHAPADSPVIVTGLDFSYVAGKTHCRGSPQLRSRLTCHGRLSADRQWEASMGTRTRPVEAEAAIRGSSQGLRSDTVLSGYAQLCARVLAPHAGRCFDLRGQGIDLGLNRVAPADLRLEESAIISEPQLSSGACAWTAPRPEALRSAVSAELSLLVRLREGLSGERAMDEAALMELLKDCDYLYCHFPDAEQGARLDLDFLKRLAVEADGMRPRLERILAALA